MDKGIRPACIAKFMELLPKRQELGNARFRKEVRVYLIEQFGCTDAAASTHYNHAFKVAKQQCPELVEGLGRPEDKKGGRKKKNPVIETWFYPPKKFTVARVKDDVIVAQDLSEEDAVELVDKAKKAKKAALKILAA